MLGKLLSISTPYTPETKDEYSISVVDYDGTELRNIKGMTGNAISLPSAPSHDGLVFQEWSASCPITNGAVTIDDNDVSVGAVYTTASGLNEFDITIESSSSLSVSLQIDGEKDWGDGTTNSETTHTYATYGNYTIKCGGTTLKTEFCSATITSARLATITVIEANAFKNKAHLANITISNSLTSMGDGAFKSCTKLTCLVIPNSVTNIGMSICYMCDGLFL